MLSRRASSDGVVPDRDVAHDAALVDDDERRQADDAVGARRLGVLVDRDAGVPHRRALRERAPRLAPSSVDTPSTLSPCAPYRAWSAPSFGATTRHGRAPRGPEVEEDDAPAHGADRRREGAAHGLDVLPRGGERADEVHADHLVLRRERRERGPRPSAAARRERRRSPGCRRRRAPETTVTTSAPRVVPRGRDADDAVPFAKARLVRRRAADDVPDADAGPLRVGVHRRRRATAARQRPAARGRRSAGSRRRPIAAPPLASTPQEQRKRATAQTPCLVSSMEQARPRAASGPVQNAAARPRQPRRAPRGRPGACRPTLLGEMRSSRARQRPRTGKSGKLGASKPSQANAKASSYR